MGTCTSRRGFKVPGVCINSNSNRQDRFSQFSTGRIDKNGLESRGLLIQEEAPKKTSRKPALCTGGDDTCLCCCCCFPSAESNTCKRVCCTLCVIYVVLCLLWTTPVWLRIWPLLIQLPEANSAHCFSLESEYVFHDITNFNESVMLTGGVLQNGTLKKGGALFAIYVDSLKPSIHSLEIIGFPPETAFKPHGIYFLSETGLLFVINHAGGWGGQRIDVFRISVSLEAYYLKTITNPMFGSAALNDLAVIDEHHFFVTRSSPPRLNASEPLDSFHSHLQLWVNYVFIGRSQTDILHCTIAPASAPKMGNKCQVAPGMGTNFGLASGINFGNNEKTVLYVSDAFSRELRVYKVDANANNYLTSQGTLAVVAPAGGIEWNPFVQRLFLGVRPINTGAIQVIPDDVDPSKGNASVLVSTERKLLASTSCANYASGNILLGSSEASGILVCPLLGG